MSKTKVFAVDRVDLVLLKSKPPKISITAYGRTTSAGWTNPEVSQYIYVHPPADGIYGFDLVAEPPQSHVAQVLSPIEVNKILDAPPKGFRGVRIHAVSGSIEALLGQHPGPESKIALKGTLTDEGVECQAFRAENGELYTLVGDLKGFKNGDQVYLAGTIAQISFCMQGITISIDWISKTPPKIAQ